MPASCGDRNGFCWEAGVGNTCPVAPGERSIGGTLGLGGAATPPAAGAAGAGARPGAAAGVGSGVDPGTGMAARWNSPVLGGATKSDGGLMPGGRAELGAPGGATLMPGTVGTMGGGPFTPG